MTQESGGVLVEASADLPARSRRYCPFNRAAGIRRVPDEPIGLAVGSSLVFHIVLIMAVVRLTAAPPQMPGAEVSAILVDIAASAPTAAAPRASAPAAAVPDEVPTVTDSAPRATPARAHGGAPAKTGGQTAAPAVALRSASVEPQATAPSIETPHGTPATSGKPAELRTPGEDAVTLVSAPRSEILEPSGPTASPPDMPLDAGWPDSHPTRFASPLVPEPAKVLTPAVRISGHPQQELGAMDATFGAVEPALRLAAPPATRVSETAALGASDRRGSTISPATASQPSPERGPEPALPVAERAPAGASTVAESPAGRRPSPFGLGLSRALVQLDGPRAQVSNQPMLSLSGRILGGPADRLTLYVNGSATEMNLSQRVFEATVGLRAGTNDIRAVVTGLDGRETADAITVQYTPPVSSGPLVLTSPPDGLTLGPDDPPIVVVEGETGDQTPSTVWIVANDRRIPVAATEGKFRYILPLAKPLVRVWAEKPDGNAMRRSEPVTVRMISPPARGGVLVMRWPTGVDVGSVEVSTTWRAHPERLDGPVQTVKLPSATTSMGGMPPDVFFLRGLKPGVHTLIVRYRGGAPLGDALATLYLPDRDDLASRALRPVSLNGTGRRVVTKILMPQAILWDQDEWFSGRSESVDTVTKFRIPDGISWVERKADLP